jgi:hypothetical protein
VTATAVDTDDDVDFDGPPGGSTVLTPFNVDDASFVQSLVTVATPDTTSNCLQTTANRFVGCQPGTKVTFRATFAVPASITRLDHDQIFSFVIRTLRNDSLVLSETPVVIVVPSTAPRYIDAWFVRDYDTTNACPMGTSPLWSFLSWDCETPSDSHIDFDVAVAPSLAELPTAARDPLLFTNPPGPASLVGTPIGAHAAVAGISTQFGGTLVDTTLAMNARARDSKTMRLRAHLVPSSDRLQAPLLRLWDQQVSCQPSE